jgi:hypothetical protein
MTITNHSFEDAAGAPGYASLWDLSFFCGSPTVYQGWFFEPADFHPTVIDAESYAKERFEDFWRLRRGLNIAGDFSVPYVWADVEEDAASIYGTTYDGYIGQISAIIESGIIPPGDTESVTVYLSYTSESEITGHSAEAVIPRGATQGTEYPFQLQEGDAGFKSIQGLTTSETLEPKIAIWGSQMLAPYNGDGVFEFSADGITVFDIEQENFELNWDGILDGFHNNFDAVARESAAFDSPTTSMEDFEDFWHLPWTNAFPGNDWGVAPNSNYNDTYLYGFEPFLRSLYIRTGASAFVLTSGQNNRIAMKWSDSGTLRDLQMALTAGAYTPTAMAAHIKSVVGAALDADGGNANSVHFDSYLDAEGRICLETLYDGAGDKPMMELVAPPSDSAWPLLGFTPGKSSQRTTEFRGLDSAAFASYMQEKFESYWNNNHLSQTVFGGADLTLATFYDPSEPGGDLFEDFEEEWILTL